MIESKTNQGTDKKSPNDLTLAQLRALPDTDLRKIRAAKDMQHILQQMTQAYQELTARNLTG